MTTDDAPIDITATPPTGRRRRHTVIARRGTDELFRHEFTLDNARERGRFVDEVLRRAYPDVPRDDWPDAVRADVERQLTNHAQVPSGAPAADGTAGAPAAPDASYVVKDGAIHHRCETFGGGVAEVPLCNFTAAIEAETARDDGAEVRRLFTISGRTAAGAELPAVDVPAKEFPAMAWVTERWGTRPVVYAGPKVRDHLRAAIQLLSPDPPTRTVYGHTGWREVGGQWVYLHAGGGIGPAGPVPGVMVELPANMGTYTLPAPPEGEDLAAAVRAVLALLDGGVAPPRITYPLVAAAFRAPLGPCDFAVHLAGRTSAFKSSLAALIQSHFGPIVKAQLQWSSTANAIEYAAFAIKDAVLVVDDFNPSAAVNPGKLHETADRVFRAAGNSAGRSRLNQDLTVRPERHPRGLLLSTGEDVPDGHSCRARLFLQELGPGDVVKEHLASYQRDAAAGLYARAMAGYVKWLAPQYARVRGVLDQERAAERDRISVPKDAHGRTPAIAGDLVLGLVYFSRFAHAVGAVDGAGAAALVDRARAAVTGQIVVQLEHHQESDPVDRFVRSIQAILMSGAAHLTSPDGTYPDQVEDRPDLCGWQRDGSGWKARGPRIGWVDRTFVYLQPTATYAALQEFSHSQRKPFGVSEQMLWRLLDGRGLLALVEDQGGRKWYAKRASYCGKQARFLHFNRKLWFSPDGTSEF